MPLVLLLMVKNEINGIEHPLRSARALCDRALVVDTGSTDGTPRRAQALGEELGYKDVFVEDLPWPGRFDEARNASLRLALQRFGPDTTALFLDADDEVRGTWSSPSGHAETVSLSLGNIAWNAIRIFPLALLPHMRYWGRVHETVHVRRVAFSGLSVVHHAGKSSFDRWRTDLGALTRDIDDLGLPVAIQRRAFFYRAQTHECLGHAAEAAIQYRLFSQRWPKAYEGYVARLRSARLHETLSLASPANVLEERLLAHGVAPHRAEALVDIAWSAREANPHVASLFAQEALRKRREGTDFFARPTAYDAEPYAILSYVCSKTGETAKGREATAWHHARTPEEPWVKQNMDYYAKVSPSGHLLPPDAPVAL